MPATEVRVFRDARGAAQVLAWLDNLGQREPVAYAKCLERILALSEHGHQLRRPHADYLRDGVYELRARFQRNQYRMLYFFVGKIAVLSNACKKPGNQVPKIEIERAIENRMLAETDLNLHTVTFET